MVRSFRQAKTQIEERENGAAPRADARGVSRLPRRANLNIAAITQKDILDFRDQREAKGLAPVTLNLDVTVLSAAFNAALGQGHIRVNPFRGIEALKVKATHKKVFTPEQVSALLSRRMATGAALSCWAFTAGCASTMPQSGLA